MSRVKTQTKERRQDTSYVCLGFFRAVSTGYAQSLKASFDVIGRQSANVGSQHRNLLCWGPTDVLSICLSDSSRCLLDFQQAHPANSNIYEDRYAFGILLHPRHLDLAVLDDLPLVGVTFVKFNRILHERVKGKEALNLLRDGIWKIVRQHERENDNYRGALVLSLGWEDIVVLSFSNSYTSIKKLIFKLRNDLTYRGLSKYLRPSRRGRLQGKRHAVVTTYTTLATDMVIHTDRRKKRIDFRDLSDSLSPLDSTLVEQILFQVRPGHLGWVQKNIPAPCERDYFTYAPGRYDVALNFHHMGIADYLVYWRDVLRQRLAANECPVLAVQTAFSLERWDTPEQDDACNNPPGIVPLSAEDRAFASKLMRSRSFPGHSSASLANALLASWYLENSFFMRGGLESLVRLLREVRARVEQGRLTPPQCQAAADVILPLVGQCFRDRFRGSYPLGEGFGTPLITYKGSFHKNLIYIDRACAEIFESIRQALSGPLMRAIRKQVFCSCLSPGFSPSMSSFAALQFNVAIVQVPLNSLVETRDLYFLFHEIGHVIQSALDLGEEIRSRLRAFVRSAYVDLTVRQALDVGSDLEYMADCIEEIVSDYVLLVAGFDGSITRYSNYVVAYAEKIGKKRVNVDVFFRIAVVSEIHRSLKQEGTITWRDISDRVLSCEDFDSGPCFNVILDFLSDEFASASKLAALINGLFRYAHPGSKTQSERRDRLRTVRRYFETGDRRADLRGWLEMLYK